MSYKKEVWVTFILAAALGLFFQLGRMGTLWPAGTLSFILRTGREIRSVQGGRARRIQQDAYLLTVEEPEFALMWKGEQR